VVFLLAAYIPRPEKPATVGAVLLALLLLAMILNRDQVRRAALEAMGFEPVAWVAPQWGVISIFAVCLVAALGIVAWMAAALARGGAPS
jgi:hypothetical protein